MTDPLSITASLAGITTAALASIQLLYTTISDIKDVPAALGDIKSDLQAVEPVIQKLRTELQKEESQGLLTDAVEGAVENCNSACSRFKERLDHWMRHATQHRASWAEWTDRVRVGVFEQGTINVFRRRLNDCKSTLNVAISTSTVLAVTRQEFIMKEVKDSILKSNEESLHQEETRAKRELAAIENSIRELSFSIRDEVNEELKRNLGQLLEEMQEEKASNKFFRQTCEEALLKTKDVHDGIEQEIKNTRADKYGKAVAGLINTSGEAWNIKQNISDTVAGEGSFAGAGIIHGLDLSIPGSKYG